MITRYLNGNPHVIWLVVFTILIAGVSSFHVMPRLEDPVLKQRVGVISVQYPGADSLEIESTVTRPIEEWLNEFSQIGKVRSNTRANVANVVIELADSVVQPDLVWTAIERKIQSKANELPAAAKKPQLKVFPLKAYAAIVAIEGGDPSGQTLASRYRIAKALRIRLLKIAGTDSVDLFGNPNEEILVRVKPDVLHSTRLSAPAIAQQIAASDVAPGGVLEGDGQSLPIEVAEADDLIDRLEKVSIRVPGASGGIALRDVASLSVEAESPPTEMAIINGQKTIVLGAMVDNDKRVDQWTEGLEGEIARLRNEYPGYSAKPIFLQRDQIGQRMDQLFQNLLLGIAAVVVVVFFFMGWRSMLVVAVSLPLSACLVVCGLRFLSIPIHQMSVTGLIVSLGLLIDNAIVMVEEIRHRLGQGKSQTQAVSDAVRHLRLPLLGSTLTTIFTFLPIAIMVGPAGEFVGSMAVSVILAISASLLLSFTIVPAMLTLLGSSADQTVLVSSGARAGWMRNAFHKTLTWVFKVPTVGVILGAALPCVGFVVAGQLPKQFFPATDRNQIQIELELPASANLNAVEKTVKKVSAIAGQSALVEAQHWFLGRSAPTFYYNVVPRRPSSPNYAQAFVDVAANTSVDTFVDQLQSEIDAEIFDARVLVRKLQQGPPFEAPIEVRIVGHDLKLLEQLGADVRVILATVPQVTHARDDLADKPQRISLEIDSELANRNGLSKNEISRFLYSSLQGSDAGEFNFRGDLIPVRVVTDFPDQQKLKTLSAMQMNVRSHNNGSQRSQSTQGAPVAPAKQAPRAAVSIGSLGQFKLSSDSGAIIRLDGERVNEVKAYLRSGVLPSEALSRFKQKLGGSDFRLPEGYRIELGGEAEKRREAVSTLVANVSVIVVLMILTLVVVLGSFGNAAIIFAVGGLTIGLGPLALFVFGLPLGFMAIVGTMGLIGVAINDSIVMLAAIGEQFQPEADEASAEDGQRPLPVRMADIVVGNARHILATTCTTMIGFLPLVVAGGKFWPPLAIVIAFGIAFATLLAFYFTPSLYLLVKGVRRPVTRSR
jgi:multidrug efflux pump subunit AcrB